MRILLSGITVTGLLILFVSRASAQDVETPYKAARLAEAARDFKTALVEYEKVLDLDVEYRDTLNRWEACQDLAGWQKDLKVKPGAMDLVKLGEIYCRYKQYDRERKAYQEAIDLDPGCTDAHGHLAMSNYTSPGGDMRIVIGHTTRFLETSPNRAHMKKVLADWAVYGQLRIFRIVMKKELQDAARARDKGDALLGAEILEAAAKKKKILDAYRSYLWVQAGEFRQGVKDVEGARMAFMESLNHAECSATIHAHIGLATLAVEAGDTRAALKHLAAATAVGSGACRRIDALRDGALEPLFTSEKAEVREAMKKLTDVGAVDEPIRAEIRSAVKRAAREGKKVLLQWYGPYCPYVMAVEERLAHPEVRQILEEKFIHVRMNQGSMHRGLSLDGEYGKVMQVHGVPCFFILNRDGTRHSVKKDAPLMSLPNRAFGVDKITAWLEKVAAE